jgi:DNA polymerase-3 subunit delta'
VSVYPWQGELWQRLTAERERLPHALLLHGSAGIGKRALAMELARWLLCQAPKTDGGCDECPSCQWFAQGGHPDFRLIEPAAEAEGAEEGKKGGKRITVDQVREVVEFLTLSAHQGGWRAVVLQPAEALGVAAANALLKTLEEPPGDVRFVLASEAAHQLLPTIRSRCLTHAMAWPCAEDALAWLQAQGLGAAEAGTLLRAAGGRPDDALLFAVSGRDPKSWHSLPREMQRGDAALVAEWSPAQVIDAQHKLCHDLMACASGAAPRFFDPADLPPAPPLAALSRWQKALAQATRSADHPFNAALMLEALVSRAQTALNSEG